MITHARRAATLGLLLCAGLTFLGCSSVDTVNTIGAWPEDADAQEMDLTGLWTGGDDLAVHVQSLENGTFKAVMVGWSNQKNAFEVKAFSGQLTRDDDAWYIHFTSPDAPDDAKQLFFFRAVKRGNSLVLFVPDAKAFQAAVDSKKLAGSYKKEGSTVNVHLTATTEALSAFLSRENAGVYFNHSDAGTLTRVAK